MPSIIKVLLDSSPSLMADTLFASASIIAVILYTGLATSAILLIMVLFSAIFGIPAFDFIATMTIITALIPFMVFCVEAVMSPKSHHPTTSTTAPPERRKSPPRDLDSQIFVAISAITAVTLLSCATCTSILGLLAATAVWLITLLCDRTNNALNIVTVAVSISALVVIPIVHAHYDDKKSAVFAIAGLVGVGFATSVAQVSAWFEESDDSATGKGLFRTAVMASLLSGVTTVGLFLLVKLAEKY